MNQHHIIQIKSEKHRLSLRFLDVSVEVRETQAMYDETFPELHELAEETDEKAR